MVEDGGGEGRGGPDCWRPAVGRREREKPRERK